MFILTFISILRSMGVPEPEDVEEVPGDRGDPGGV